MARLQPSLAHHGHWLMGEHELVDGDTLEVSLLGRWYHAQVKYNWVLQEYRLHVLGQDMPFPAEMKTPARPPQPDGHAELKDTDPTGAPSP